MFARHVVTQLGGLTGDVYGAITEISEIIVLGVYLFANSLRSRVGISGNPNNHGKSP
jgi:cobalamin synthase